MPLLDIFFIYLHHHKAITMKKILSIILLSGVCILQSCTSQVKPDMAFDGQILKFNAPDKSTHTVQYSFMDKAYQSYKFTENAEIDLTDILKQNPEDVMDIAYSYAEKNGLPVKLHIDGKIDTTVVYNIPFTYQTDSVYCTISGTCLPIKAKYESNDTERDVKKWLYQNSKHLDAMQVWTMKHVVEVLTSSSLKEYTSDYDGIVPIVTSLEGTEYTISTNVVADHYYLLATSIGGKPDSLSSHNPIRTKVMEEFIANEVANDFKNGSYSPNRMKCHVLDTPTTAILFFIAINSDWTKTVLPIGIVRIDDSKPAYDYSYRNQFESVALYGDETYVSTEYALAIQLPKQSEQTHGAFYINWGNFRGSVGYPYQIPFTIEYSGDIKGVYINGEYHNTPSDRKKIAFTQSITLRNLGDNYIPVKAIDNRGNVNETTINISIQKIKDDE